MKPRITLGDGTAEGEVALPTRTPSELRLTGKSQARNVEFESAFEAFKRRSIIAGKVSVDATLSAHDAEPAKKPPGDIYRISLRQTESAKSPKNLLVGSFTRLC